MLQEVEGQRLVIGVRPSPSSEDEVRGIGYQAGRDDRDFVFVLDRRSSKNAQVFRRNLVSKLSAQPVYVERYLPQIWEIVDTLARKFAIILSKVSDEAAERLYKGCPERNIRHVRERKFKEYVEYVLPEELSNAALLRPLEQSFWTGWFQGSGIMNQWRKLHARRRSAPVSATASSSSPKQ